MSEKDIRSRMSAPREYPFAPAIIKKDIPRNLAFRIEELRPELRGVAIDVSWIRYYPYKETASHIIGYIGTLGLIHRKIRRGSFLKEDASNLVKVCLRGAFHSYGTRLSWLWITHLVTAQ